MSDNTLQYEWIVTLEGGMEALFKDNEAVFVAGNLLWYPVEGDPKIRTAPDVMIAFGRPKGHRESYMQWVEGGVAPQVVFEVLSKGNQRGEMLSKYAFYEQYGVQEYYIYNPYKHILQGFVRQCGHFVAITEINGYVSPLLGVRFVLDPPGSPLQVIGPDGRPFASFQKVIEQHDQAERQALQAVHRADQEKERARQERLQRERIEEQIEQERLQRERIEAQFEQERRQREQAEERTRQVEQQLRDLLERHKQNDAGPDEIP